MFRNFIKTAFRNLRKNKTFSLINIAGLSIGMAACLLILQYVSFELSYDQYNKNAPDIYRVANDRYQKGKLIQHGTITYSAIGKAMQDDFPEVLDHTRVEPGGKSIITAASPKKIGDLDLLYADNSFLSMFTYPLIAGDAATALREPHSIILPESSATKIFGAGAEKDWSSLIGRTINLGMDSTPYKITGIARNVPENTHLPFDLLASYSTLYSGKDSWKEADYDFKDSDFWHYIQLRHGTDYKALEAKLPAFSQRHFQGDKVSGSEEKFFLQPLSRAHLYSDFEYEIGKTGSATVVWGLLIIAALIIVIAWVNYINLATAKSMERAKEVGIRKVSGATKGQLIRQFLMESLIINITALIIAVLIVWFAQKGLNDLVQHHLSLAYLFQKGLNGYSITSALAALIIAGIFISGLYPALVLSAFKPILVLKGKFTRSVKGAWLRKTLVIGQFAITVVLIIGSFIVYQQIKFVNEQSLGMNISQMLIVKPPELTRWDSTFIVRETSFAEELKKINGVKGAATSNRVAGDELGRNFNVRRAEAPENEKFTMRNMSISSGFIDIYGIRMLAGRNFTETDYSPDWNHLHNTLINESAARLLGFSTPQASIGRTILTGNKKWDIIGVIADVHQKSLRYPIEPTIFRPSFGTDNPISVKITGQNLPATIASVKEKYESFFPGNLFDYYFVDEKFNALYKTDQLFGKVFALFSGLAIAIACLGLFGLSLFATAQRTKEIGVRKILGASIPNIVLLLSKDFFGLILIANALAFPVAWLIMHNWLKDFAYRITISGWIFVVAGLMAMVVALVTISLHSIRAALANPVKSLRTE
ncbi:MAG TPA: ABC transporter permease [Puia sp.]|nr:ABC transporter permease [Puia sp.]